jgi:hypothetical protein
MGLLRFEKAGITAMAACVPQTEIDNLAYTQHFSADEVKKGG